MKIIVRKIVFCCSNESNFSGHLASFRLIIFFIHSIGMQVHVQIHRKLRKTHNQPKVKLDRNVNCPFSRH